MKDPALDPFRERAPLHVRTLRVLGHPVRFESENLDLLALAAAGFGGLPAPGRGGARAVFRVRLQLTGKAAAREPPLLLAAGAGFLAGTGGGSNVALIAPAARSAFIGVSRAALRRHYCARYELLEFAVLTLLARALGLVPLHAAFVVHRGRGALLLGDTGAGKSTLCLHSILERMAFLSEDAVFATRDGARAAGVPAFLHLRRDSVHWLRGKPMARALRDARVIRRRSRVRKFEIDLRRCGARLTTGPTPISTVIILRRRAVADSQPLQPISPRQLRAELAKTQPYASGRPEWRAFLRGIARKPAYELGRASHPRVALQALRKLLEGLP